MQKRRACAEVEGAAATMPRSVADLCKFAAQDQPAFGRQIEAQQVDAQRVRQQLVAEHSVERRILELLSDGNGSAIAVCALVQAEIE